MAAGLTSGGGSKQMGLGRCGLQLKQRNPQLTGNELHHLPAEFTRVDSFFAGSKVCLARGQPLAAVRSMFVIARATQTKGAKAGKAGHKGLPSRAPKAQVCMSTL